jgi:putative addiction module CopG family antidote
VNQIGTLTEAKEAHRIAREAGWQISISCNGTHNFGMVHNAFAVNAEAMEEFVRQKVAIGDYETASEVVREGLRLLKQRDEVWKADVRDRIEQGMDSIRDYFQTGKRSLIRFKEKGTRKRKPPFTTESA